MVVLAGEVFRHLVIAPRSWVAACAAATRPAACLPRSGVLWLQQTGLCGDAALALGGLAVLLGGRAATRATGIAAVATGCFAVVNYDAGFGMLGAALGGWAWLTRPAIDG